MQNQDSEPQRPLGGHAAGAKDRGEEVRAPYRLQAGGRDAIFNKMTTFTKSPYEGENSQIDNDLVPEHLKE